MLFTNTTRHEKFPANTQRVWCRFFKADSECAHNHSQIVYAIRANTSVETIYNVS